MAVTHLTQGGSWVECATPAECELLFHLPDTTPEQMQVTPLSVLLPLLNIIDPPDEVGSGGFLFWRDTSGRKHRDYDLPAIVHPKSMHWCKHGTRHRDGGKPAIVFTNGRQEWWVNDVKHRADGPALITEDGTEIWYKEGMTHRIGGPAVIYPDGEGDYWEDGVNMHKIERIAKPRPRFL